MFRPHRSKFKRVGLSLAAVLLFIGQVFAMPQTGSSQLLEYLNQEKLNLRLAITVSKSILTPKNALDLQTKLEENKAQIALNKAKIATLQNFLVSQKKLQMDLSQRLKQLEQVPILQTPQISTQEKIEKINLLKDVNKKTIELINDNIDLATTYQTMLMAESQRLQLQYAKVQMEQRLTNLRDNENQLTASLQTLVAKNLTLQQEMKETQNFKTAYFIEAKLLLNNQLINLTQYKIAELALQRKLTRADFLLLKSPDIRTLQTVTEIYQNVTEQLSEMELSLKTVVNTLKNEVPHISDPALKQQFQSLIRIVNGRIAGIVIHEQTLEEDLENHNQELKKQLSVRQSLSEYRFDSWPEILKQLANIPSQFYTYLKSLSIKIKENYLWQDRLHPSLLWLLFALFLSVVFGLSRLFKQLAQDKERSRLSSHLYHGLLTILSRNLPQLSFAAFVLLVFYFTQVPFSNYQLLANLTIIWITYRTLMIIARLALFERISDETGSDVKLYYRIKWLLITGFWTINLMVLSYQLPLTLIMQDIFNRLFMLFLLVISFVAWKSREVINHLLHPILETKRNYFRHAVIIMLILVPITLFVIAFIGLVGYVNLAWTLSRYQIQLLLIITAYILLQGLLFDALELISEWMIEKQTNGWLWIEVFLKPLDRVFRILLFLSCIYVLFILFGWTSKSTVVTTLFSLGQYPLLNLSGIYITSFSIVEFLIALSVVTWSSKWTREFSYRWLYRNAKDSGIRNSLSVFTQYAIVLVGGLITFRILGIDFSGMSLLIGGLAVGMGFGLRDFASNIVGGLMLLIERPVRVGDLISLGGYEGRVAHIGIRSMRVSSWDNMEVLIPNAETFNKPFTNWTHQDSIVRTVVPIKVSREDDPIMVQQLILDVLAIIPEILPEPAPHVFLMKIDEGLVEFEARYFINIQLYTRFEIRSKVLFAITAQFKAADIKAPIPPLSVEFKESDIHAERV